MAGRVRMDKDPARYPSVGAPHIGNANDIDHSRFRRTLAHAFSDRALADQEGIIQRFVDQLITCLGDITQTTDGVVDLAKWYVWISFDIVTDLTYGEPFGCLQNQATHRYVDLLAASWKGFRLHYILTYWPWVRYLGNLVIDKTVLAARKEFREWTYEQTRKRLFRETQRPDFIKHILKHSNVEKGEGMSTEEIQTNSLTILTAGSETTSSLLSGVTYMLLRHPNVLSKLQSEVRCTWQAYEQITLDAVKDSPYLNAVITEGLRYFPPVPTGLNRIVPLGGQVISGLWIPEGTSVCVSPYAAHRSDRNFRDADCFIPERWLDNDDRFKDDNKNSYQPWSCGPRNCIGKSVAYAEARLILAKMTWSFDMQLETRSEDWMARCRSMIVWDLPELAVRLKAVDPSKASIGQS